MTTGKRAAVCVWLCAGSLLACATPPRPRELDAYETPSATERAGGGQALARPGGLLRQAGDEGARSGVERSGGARRDALLAQIKLKTALALLEQEQLKARIQSVSNEQAGAEEEYASVSKDLASEAEKLTLLQKYLEARKSAAADKERLSQQMSSDQQKADAEQQRLSQQLATEQKIAAAQLALHTAETGKYAKAEYAAAGDMLTKALAEIKENDPGAQARRGRKEEPTAPPTCQAAVRTGGAGHQNKAPTRSGSRRHRDRRGERADRAARRPAASGAGSSTCSRRRRPRDPGHKGAGRDRRPRQQVPELSSAGHRPHGQPR
jgi:hypothetical protein